MREIWLVAFREYLSYVRAWGFWLGLLMTPLFMFLGIALPQMIEKNQPIRYYTVISDTPDFAQALAARIDRERADEARAILLGAIAIEGADRERQVRLEFDAALAAGQTPEDALAGIVGDTPELAHISVPPRRLIAVEAPASTPDGLRDWLLGGAMVEGPDGPKPLFAALIVSDTAAGPQVDYWSENVTETSLRRHAQQTAYELVERGLYAAAGLDAATVDRAVAATPRLIEQRVRTDGTGSEVTVSDRAPFLAAVALAVALWLLIFSVVNYLLMGTIEERSNKIFDAVLTSVKLNHLLLGKLLGILMLSATLVTSWSLMATWLILQMGDRVDPLVLEFLSAAGQPGLLIPAVISFAAGYLMYGAMFLALGSLCDTIQEAQSLLSPMFVVLMMPLLVIPVAIADPASAIVATLSWMPLLTPFLLILRIPLELPWWELGSAILLMVGFAALVLMASARVYRAGAVHGVGIGAVKGWFAGLMGRKKV
jgi:ABC-2 type transport system permease protein